MLKVATLVVALVASVLWFVPTTSALTVVNCNAAGISSDDCAVTKDNSLNYDSKSSRIWTIIQFVLGILGGIAVIMIVIGGIKYTLSQGDSSSLNSAKNTILYSVIGLVVAMLASAIVLLVQNFFLK